MSSAKEKAIKDIRESLRVQGKCFLAFHRELNPIMDKLVNEHIKAQELCVNSRKVTESLQ